jgi:hypothetical protein
VNSGQPAEHRLHAVGQRLISEVLAGKHRVATDGWNLSACGTAGIHLSLPMAGEFDRVLGQPLCPSTTR